MRLFISISIPEVLKNSLSLDIASLSKTPFPFRWTKPETWHFTLKFLGEVDGSKIDGLRDALKKVVLSRKSALAFEAALSERLGGFPRLGPNSKVIWVGLSKGEPEMNAIAKSLELALNEPGFANETKPFRPHLTLSRIRDKSLEMEQVKILEEMKISCSGQVFKVNSLELMESVLTPTHAEYRVIESYSFP